MIPLGSVSLIFGLRTFGLWNVHERVSLMFFSTSNIKINDTAGLRIIDFQKKKNKGLIFLSSLDIKSMLVFFLLKSMIPLGSVSLILKLEVENKINDTGSGCIFKNEEYIKCK